MTQAQLQAVRNALNGVAIKRNQSYMSKLPSASRGIMQTQLNAIERNLQEVLRLERIEQRNREQREREARQEEQRQLQIRNRHKQEVELALIDINEAERILGEITGLHFTEGLLSRGKRILEDSLQQFRRDL